jgi:hypothetical protein
LARTDIIFGSAAATASTWLADRRLPAGGTFDAGTGIGAAVFVERPDDVPAERAGEAALA